MHKRAEIKDKVVEMLQASGSAITRVYKARYLDLPRSLFPAACVYCPEDVSEKAPTDEHYNRNAKVIIVIYCIGYDASEEGETTGQRDIDTELDDITKEVETIFNKKFQTLEGTVYQMNAVSTKYSVDTKTEDIIGIATMEYEAQYKDSVL